jgi:small neutral amino acid transporter SnatA (MarC family)
MKLSKNDLLFYTAILFAIWFACTGIVWVYWVALIIAYPIGLVSLFIWLYLKKENRARNKWILRILIVGLLISLSVLMCLLICG